MNRINVRIFGLRPKFAQIFKNFKNIEKIFLVTNNMEENPFDHEANVGA